MPFPFDAVFIVGPQGSGKGTQAKILAEKLEFFYWEMGGILREERTRRLVDGHTVGELIDEGVLLSDSQLLEVVQAKLPDIPQDRGIVFDGIPRRIGQAEFLLDFLRGAGRQKILTMALVIPEEESVRRLLSRAKIEGRKDDTPEAIHFRLAQYREATLPMLEYLKAHTAYREVDGSPPVEAVTRAIDEKLRALSNEKSATV